MKRYQYYIEVVRSSFVFSKALDLAADGEHRKSFEMMEKIQEFVLVRSKSFCTLKGYLYYAVGDQSGLEQCACYLEQQLQVKNPSPDDIHLSIYMQECLDGFGIDNETIKEISLHDYNSDLVSDSTRRKFPLKSQ